MRGHPTRVKFHHGVIPNDPNKARLYFRMFRKAGVTPPVIVDYDDMPVIGMLGNDRYGDCVFAGNGHTIEEQTHYGQGTEYVVNTDDVLAAYARVTGFNPNDPNTDNGAMIQDGLSDLRKVGFGGHKIAAFAQIDPRVIDDVKLAVAEFGAVAIGFSVPSYAMTQFNAGKPWVVQTANAGIVGGHRVAVVGYDANWIYVLTWNAVQKMSYAFWAKYVDEVWCHIGEDWVSAAKGTTPTGVDKYAFGEQFAALTHEVNPFPRPIDPPPPPPEPVLTQAEINLANAAHKYLRLASRSRLVYLSKALSDWLRSKGLLNKA